MDLKIIIRTVICIASASIIGCASGILGGPVRVSGPGSQWQVSVEILQEGPDWHRATYQPKEWERKMKQVCVPRSHMRDDGGSCYVGAPVPPKAVELKLVPKDDANGFMWMKVAVRNAGAVANDFDFSRIRLIFPKYVSRPEIIYTHEQTVIDDFSQAVGPGKEMVRYLIFTYRKGTAPYRFVYDQQIQGRVAGKIAADFQTAQSN